MNLIGDATIYVDIRSRHTSRACSLSNSARLMNSKPCRRPFLSAETWGAREISWTKSNHAFLVCAAVRSFAQDSNCIKLLFSRGTVFVPFFNYFNVTKDKLVQVRFRIL